jgi:3-oxoacyl-[acyl-carrier-protein] synthase II
MSHHRVVITGMGAITPLGHDRQTLQKNLEEGHTGVCNMLQQWGEDADHLTCHIASPVKGDIGGLKIPRALRRSMGRVAILAHHAASEAIEEAALDEHTIASGHWGVSFSSTLGSTQTLDEAISKFHYQDFASSPSSTFFQVMSHTCAANLAHAFGFRGRIVSPDCACASGAAAIGLAFEAIREGRQDGMIAGGADELHPLVTACFDLVHASSYSYNDNPTKAPRPFDENRDGVVCGEGAGAIVMESEASAKKRKADILGEVVGFSMLSEGGHLAEPTTSGVYRCMQSALDNAGLFPDSIGCVCAHATGTPRGDAAEAEGLEQVFGKQHTPVFSLKGHLGHTMGASGAIETIATMEMLRRKRLVATRNLEAASADCQRVRHAKAGDIPRAEAAIKNCFAFGGVNAVLIVKRYK